MFLFSKDSPNLDYESEDIYIYKKDIKRLITLIANEIVSYVLNRMVDKNLMKLYWDNKIKDFMWLETVK